jgi:hypothetical protein
VVLNTGSPWLRPADNFRRAVRSFLGLKAAEALGGHWSANLGLPGRRSSAPSGLAVPRPYPWVRPPEESQTHLSRAGRGETST